MMLGVLVVALIIYFIKKKDKDTPEANKPLSSGNDMAKILSSLKNKLGVKTGGFVPPNRDDSASPKTDDLLNTKPEDLLNPKTYPELPVDVIYTDDVPDDPSVLLPIRGRRNWFEE